MNGQTLEDGKTDEALTRKPPASRGRSTQSKATIPSGQSIGSQAEHRDIACADFAEIPGSRSHYSPAPHKTKNDDFLRRNNGNSEAKVAQGTSDVSSRTRFGTTQALHSSYQPTPTEEFPEYTQSELDERQLNRQEEVHRSEMEESEKKLADEKASYHALEAENGEQAGKIRSLAMENADLKRWNTDLDHRRAKALKSFENLRDENLAKLDQVDKTFIPDDVLQKDLKDLKQSMENWVAEYAIKNVQAWKQIRLEVSRTFGEQKPFWYISKAACSAMTQGKLSPRVVLGAWLANLAFRNLFESGLSWVSDTVPVSSSSDRLYKFLQQVQDTSKKGDPLQGPRWRSLTLEILQQFEKENPSTCPSGYLDPKVKRADYVEKLFNQINTRCNSLLHQVSREEVLQRETELKEMLQLMCRLSTRCMQQPVIVRLVFAKKDLTELKHLKFPANSELFDARSMKGPCDKDDPSIVGREIGLVIRPAIVVMKKKRATEDRDYTVWLKGLVWLEDQSEQNAGTGNKESQGKGRSKRKQAETATAEEQEPPKKTAKHGNKTNQNNYATSNNELRPPIQEPSPELAGEAAESSRMADQNRPGLVSNGKKTRSRAQGGEDRGRIGRCEAKAVSISSSDDKRDDSSEFGPEPEVSGDDQDEDTDTDTGKNRKS